MITDKNNSVKGELIQGTWLELHRTNEEKTPVLVRISAINGMYIDGTTTVLTIGGENYYVAESYNEVKKLLGLPVRETSVVEDKATYNTTYDEMNKIISDILANLEANSRG